MLPRWSGDMLDLVVDFTTYVFVPAYAIAAAACCRPWSAFVLGLVIVVTGALYFADRNMKTADNYFRGFPAVWNVVAFYLLLLQPDAVDLRRQRSLVLAVLTFVPIRFVHPFRVRRLRAGDDRAAGAVGGAGGHRALCGPAAGALGQGGAVRYRRLFPRRSACCRRAEPHT